jgi:hydrocephalus-inducing protein
MDPLVRQKGGIPMRPSELTKDRALSLPEKLASHATACALQKPVIAEILSAEPTVARQFSVPVDAPLFEPFPSSVMLQAYEPFQKYEVVIAFRNADKVTL